MTEALVKDGVVQSAAWASGADPLKDAGGTIALAPNTPIPGDCWSECLFMAYGNKNFRVPISSLFADNHKIRSVSRQDEGGPNSSVVVDMSHERMRLEITFSVRHNCLARRIVLWSLDGARHPDSTLTVTDFLEVEPGVYIPRKVVAEVPDPASGKVKTKKTFEITDAKINQPIPAEAMGFRFPTGATVLDLTTRKAYKADASGQATQPALSASGQPIEVASGTLSPVAMGQSGAAQFATEAADEPKRWTVLLRYMALFALALGLGVWGYNRMRRGR
ncbi:hypothetical protein J0H58_24410 [bacterium]|nr:hypothetical protein [bacterium]